MDEENELITLRRKKLDALRAKGIEPFGGSFLRNGTDYRTSKPGTGNVIWILLRMSIPARYSKNASQLSGRRGASSRTADFWKWRRRFCRQSQEVRPPNRSEHIIRRSASIFICASRWSSI